MWFTPASIARRITLSATERSLGGPNTPGPGSCIAPKPMRRTYRLPSRTDSSDMHPGYTGFSQLSRQPPLALSSDRDTSGIVCPARPVCLVQPWHGDDVAALWNRTFELLKRSLIRPLLTWEATQFSR